MQKESAAISIDAIRTGGGLFAAGDFWTLALARLAQRLRCGRLTLIAADGARRAFGGAEPGPHAEIRILRARAARRLLLGGAPAFADSYIDGDWDTPDLAALMELALCNEARLAAAMSGSPLRRLFERLRHWRRANTRRGSARNIAYHYDLGNRFYAAWLDPGLTYSSALYQRGDETLEAAQAAKIDRVLALAGIGGGQRVLEIGCGWGGLAEAALQRHDCHLTGITLSREQLAHARERLAPEIARGTAEFLLQDYRDAAGVYDRILSIEMLEAVGEENWPLYFGLLRDRLAPGGRAVLQVITIADARYDSYRRSPDFIQRYIFPGGMLPSPSRLRRHVAEAGLRLASAETFGASYAQTLAEWRARFRAAWPEIEAMGFDARFRRMWEYYLAYCEAGFREGSIDVGLYAIDRPG